MITYAFPLRLAPLVTSGAVTRTFATGPAGVPVTDEVIRLVGPDGWPIVLPDPVCVGVRPVEIDWRKGSPRDWIEMVREGGRPVPLRDDWAQRFGYAHLHDMADALWFLHGPVATGAIISWRMPQGAAVAAC